jgi:hypothetical protein
MSNESKTIWNKTPNTLLFDIPKINVDAFSFFNQMEDDTNAQVNANNTKSNNDDIHDIQEKMQNLKKKKKKNEILKNVYNTPPISENFQQPSSFDTTQNTTESFSIEETKNSIFKNMDNFNENAFYYTTFLYYIVDYGLTEFICKPYINTIDKLNNKLKFAKTDTNNNIENDVNILKQTVYALLSFFISIFVMYNWYYLIIFRHEISLKDPTKKVQLTEFDLTINVENPFIKSMVDFLFLYCLEPVRLMNNFLLNFEKLPLYFNMIPFHNLKRLIILWVSYCFVYFCNIFNIFKLLFSTADISSFFAIILFFVNATIGMLYFTQAYKMINETVTFTKENPGPIEILNFISKKFESLFVPFFVKAAIYIIYLFIKFIIAMFSIKIATIILFLYLWCNSLFGISIINTEDGITWKDEFMGFIGLTQSKVDKECEKEIELLSDPCFEEWWESIFKLGMLTLNNGTYNILLFILLLILIPNLYSIECIPVQIITQFLILILAIIVLFLIFFKFIKNYKNIFVKI